MNSVILPSRTGASFMGTAEVESDGSLVIQTTANHGYLSAHRDYARSCGYSQKIVGFTHVNLSGVRVATSGWAQS